MFEAVKGLFAARAAKKAKEKIGQGAYGQVFAHEQGTVKKYIPEQNRDQLLKEINMQAKASDLRLAPKIKEATTQEMGGEIVMDDLRKNYIPLGVQQENLNTRLTGAVEPQTQGYTYYNSALNSNQITQAKVETHKQLAQLALNGVMLNDRHAGNIFIHKLTNRPIQIDFGLAEPLANESQKAGALAYHVSNGLKESGLTQEAHILLDLVNEIGSFDVMTNTYRNPKAALDMAKQGLSRLQKIKMDDIKKISSYENARLQKAIEKNRAEMLNPAPVQRLNTWGEPISTGYYGTPVT